MKRSTPRRCRRFFCVCVLLTVAPFQGLCENAITTQRYDNARTGQNLSEKFLNTTNVQPETFGKLFTRAVDDEVYAQPLYVANVIVPKVGLLNVLYVATVNNSVFAFDADNPSAAAPLWHINLPPREPNVRPVKASDVAKGCGIPYRDFRGNIGIVGTPVIDTANNTLYVVARTRRESPAFEAAARRVYAAVDRLRAYARAMERADFADQLNAYIGGAHRPVIYATTGTLWLLARRLEGVALALESGTFVQELHALDIATGVERPNSPVVIKARVEGTGRGSLFGKLTFDPAIHNQRGALLLANGIIYITWASHCDAGPYHGWIMGYDPKTLEQVLAKVVTANGKGGGIWQSNAGPSADEAGNVYLTVGNGTVTAHLGGQDYGNSFLKLTPSGEVLDWFTPFNFEWLNNDIDLGAAGVLLIPNTNLLTSGGKEGKLYVLDRTNLGHFHKGSDDQIVQKFYLEGPLFSTPTYWDGPGGPYVYTWCRTCHGQTFVIRNNLLTAVGHTKMSAGRGGMLSISADGVKPGTGILWANTGELRAFDAADVSHELWNSEQNGERDKFGEAAKYNTPVVANGKVYLATFSNQIVVYGLLPEGNSRPTVSAGSDQRITLPNQATINGKASDETFPPPPAGLSTTWVQVNGPGQVTFGDPHSLSTTAAFAAPGRYVLRLTASNGGLAADSDVTVEVLPPT
jgi:K319L-like, PKD domain